MNPPPPDYETDPVLPEIPPRSRLFHLVPFGVGTPRVESLTSYISRLAKAHSVTTGTLVTRDIAYTLRTGAVPTDLCTCYTAMKQSGEWVNGLNSTARRWVEALEKLTLRRDLACLTMVNWGGLFRPVGVMREKKAWCPQCYQDAQDEHREPYDQLLWALQDAACCPDHGCLLVSLCPHCGKDNPHLGWRARPGYCNSCYDWVGAKNVEHKGATPWDRWRSRDVANLLSVITGETGETAFQIPPKQRISEALRTLAEARGIKRRVKLAKLLDFRREGVVDWFYGFRHPAFSSLLVICGKLRVSLRDYLFADMRVLADLPPDENIPDVPVRVLRRRPKTELEAVLRDALQHGDPSDTLRTICERAGWGRSGARANCRELSKKITARRKEHLQENAGDKKQKVFNESRELIRRLRTEGHDLSASAMAQRLPKPGVLRAAWGREAFAEAMKAEGLEVNPNFRSVAPPRHRMQVTVG